MSTDTNTTQEHTALSLVTEDVIRYTNQDMIRATFAVSLLVNLGLFVTWLALQVDPTVVVTLN